MFKGKGSALDSWNYCGLKLTDQVLKVVERVIEQIIREYVVLILCSLVLCLNMEQLMLSSLSDNFKKKYLDKNKNLYFAFIDLEKSFNSIDFEKAFNRVPCKVV